MDFLRCCSSQRVEIDTLSLHSREPMRDDSLDDSYQINNVQHGGSHCAKWWYSTVHISTAMVGAGVLALPSAMAQLDWWPGIMMLVISWIITLCTLWQMIELHEMEDHRFDRYQDLGKRAFGDKLGLWIVGSQQVIVQVTANVAYMLTGGHALKRFAEILKIEKNNTAGHVWWIAVFGSVQLVVSMISNFDSVTMTTVSGIATLMSVCYSTIVWISLAGWGHESNCNCNNSRNIFKAFNAIGDIAFAYGGHNVALEIQSTMRSTELKPSKIPMWNGVLVAYILVAVCYFPVASIGYWKLGTTSCFTNVLEDLKQPMPLIATANLMVMVHLTGSYQVFAIPMFDLIQKNVPKAFAHTSIIRPIYVALTCLFATAIPFFGELLGMFGGLALTPTTYFLPCIMWLLIKKPRVLSLSWLANWACILFGVALMLVAFVGSLISIISGFRKHQYKLFHFPRTNCTNKT